MQFNDVVCNVDQLCNASALKSRNGASLSSRFSRATLCLFAYSLSQRSTHYTQECHRPRFSAASTAGGDKPNQTPTGHRALDILMTCEMHFPPAPSANSAGVIQNSTPNIACAIIACMRKWKVRPLKPPIVTFSPNRHMLIWV